MAQELEVVGGAGDPGPGLLPGGGALARTRGGGAGKGLASRCILGMLAHFHLICMKGGQTPVCPVFRDRSLWSPERGGGR